MKVKNDKKISYDREADVLAIYLGKGQEDEYREIAPNIGVEFNKKGAVIGIEILNASRVLKPVIESSKSYSSYSHS